MYLYIYIYIYKNKYIYIYIYIDTFIGARAVRRRLKLEALNVAISITAAKTPLGEARTVVSEPAHGIRYLIMSLDGQFHYDFRWTVPLSRGILDGQFRYRRHCTPRRRSLPRRALAERRARWSEILGGAVRLRGEGIEQRSGYEERRARTRSWTWHPLSYEFRWIYEFRWTGRMSLDGQFR